MFFKSSRNPGRKPSFRPSIEVLEDRTTPSFALTETLPDTYRAVTTDGDGNIYAVGFKEVARYSANGVLDWKHTILTNNSGTDDDVGIVARGSGNNVEVYVSGSVYSPFFYPNPPTVSGTADAYVLKLDGNGNAIWVQTYGTPGYDRGREIAFSGNNELVQVGWSTAGADVRRIETSTGNQVGTMVFSGSGFAEAVAVRGNRIHVAGRFSGTLTVGGINLVSAGGYDGFLAIVTPNGTVVTATRYGGTLDDRAEDVALDSTGNVYVTGGWTINNGTTRLFISRLGSWTQFYSNGFSDYSNGYGNTLTISGNRVYAGGYGQNAAGTKSELFMVIANTATGTGTAITSTGGNGSHGQIWGLTTDNLGNINGVGDVHQNVTFWGLTFNGLGGKAFVFKK